MGYKSVLSKECEKEAERTNMQAAGLGRPHPGSAAFREAPLTGRSLDSFQARWKGRMGKAVLLDSLTASRKAAKPYHLLRTVLFLIE